MKVLSAFSFRRRRPIPRSWQIVAVVSLLTGISCLLASPRLHLAYGLDETVDNVFLDQYFRLRGAQSPQDVAEKLPHTRDIVMVELNHQVPRHLLAQVVWKLRLARVVALDLMLIDREGELEADEKPWYRAEIATWHKQNAQLAATMQRTHNVVVGAWLEEVRHTSAVQSGRLQTHLEWRRPPAVIWKSARAHGHLVANTYDGVVRRVHLQHPTPDTLDSTRTLPALSLAVADVARKTRGRHKKYFEQPGGGMLIDYVGGRECFEFDSNRIVYARVLDLWEPEDFRDKIVIVGETSLQAKEISETPFGTMPSMQVHANALATLLGRGEPQTLPLWQTALIAWSGSLLLVVPLLRWPLWASFLLAMVQGLTLVFVGAWIFITWHKVLPASVPLAALALTYNTLALWEYRRARRTLGRFIGDEMVAGTLHPLRELERGGREEIATALFCDMRGYSGLAEHLPPARLAPLTDAYHQIVIDVAERFGGRAIDFQGDGVFVLFETGLAGEEHAAQAVRAAIVMQASFETLQARRNEWGVHGDDKAPQRLEFGIGIATGVMMIGVLGAQQRLHLGAAGDTVNIAARVEGLTRDFPYPILITGSTYERVQKLVHATSCGVCELHGRSSTIEVWGIDGLIDQDDSLSPLRNQLSFS